MRKLCGRPSHGFENKSQYDAGFTRKPCLKDKAVLTILGPTTTPQTLSNRILKLKC